MPIRPGVAVWVGVFMVTAVPIFSAVKNKINKDQNVNYIRWIMNTRKKRKGKERKGMERKRKKGKERNGREGTGKMKWEGK